MFCSEHLQVLQVLRAMARQRVRITGLNAILELLGRGLVTNFEDEATFARIPNWNFKKATIP